MYKDEYIYIYKFNHKIFFEIVINRVTLLVLHEEIFFFFYQSIQLIIISWK